MTIQASASEVPSSVTISVTHVHVRVVGQFDDFIKRMDRNLGRHDVSAYQNLVSDPANAKKVEAIIKAQAGASGLMTFAIYNHGELLTIKNGKPSKAKQYVIGNPLIAATMTVHDVRAALYAPLRILVYQAQNGFVDIDYDLPSSLFGQLKNPQIDVVAHELDKKLEKLISDSTKD